MMMEYNLMEIYTYVCEKREEICCGSWTEA